MAIVIILCVVLNQQFTDLKEVSFFTLDIRKQSEMSEVARSSEDKYLCRIQALPKSPL